MSQDLHWILSNPPKVKYLTNRTLPLASLAASVEPAASPTMTESELESPELKRLRGLIEALQSAIESQDRVLTCQINLLLRSTLKTLRITRGSQKEGGFLLKKAFCEIRRVPPCMELEKGNLTYLPIEPLPGSRLSTGKKTIKIQSGEKLPIIPVSLPLQGALDSKKAQRKDTEDDLSLSLPANEEDPLDFVLFMINANSLSTNEDRETVLSRHTYQSYLTVARAVAHKNEGNPFNPIQPIKLVTFGNGRGSNVSSWCTDKEGQQQLADIVNMNLGDDPNPTIIYQTSYKALHERDRIFILQSAAKLVMEMMTKIQPRRTPPDSEEFFGFRFLKSIRKRILRVQTLDMIRYLHTSILWLLGCFIAI